VLTLNNPQDVREEITQYLESVGLGGLVRAGI
jgi:phosphotransferase system enzyme I (PtsP)